ncbi:MAG: 3-dehydroquinate synthase, partial [Actinobacteria bacterium]|nr:3-dehydroquinate synthase [Actinomycetota bacterium]NIS31765.1 3-dehydroquinate synthase [Actinomycetota bacterium]NIU66862.1 3-dehydroquinate synthase [Actinomycetota bacterium]NIV87464.1 3-dehydroquinate synthase [Actinomycetota bacterium]NIW28662.1 3-dehydroquinate synthase [Actinomycetota bacterium]
HGEAVAVGLVAESAIGEAVGVTRAGVAERVRAVVERAGLPARPPDDVDPDRLFRALA